jgi:5-methylcytosine-specific restriction endonuclease McrA
VNKCQNCQAVLPSKSEGKLGRNQIYCNALCGQLFRGNIKFFDKPVICLFCGKTLAVAGQRVGRPKRYCNKSHGEKYLYSLKPKAPKLEKSCAWCSKTFETNLSKMQFCSRDCNNACVRDKKIKATQAKHKANPRRFDFECDRCKQIVVTDVCIRKTYSGRFCRNCSLVKRRERYRLKTANRQKIMNPIRVSADVLIERDGSVCHLCNAEIDLSLARNSRFGATIDHVVPVSKGGADTLENMRLAHWICNIKKGNRI